MSSATPDCFCHCLGRFQECSCPRITICKSTVLGLLHRKSSEEEFKGTLQAKYEFTSVYRAVHADFSSAVRFLIRVVVYEILLDM